jgi:hypothetical protein
MVAESVPSACFPWEVNFRFFLEPVSEGMEAHLARHSESTTSTLLATLLTEKCARQNPPISQ